uniref:Uncharacterized protein n=1 Tax=Arundo donax TaxID=35708 RepID=A0A0A9I089_ARUDO
MWLQVATQKFNLQAIDMENVALQWALMASLKFCVRICSSLCLLLSRLERQKLDVSLISAFFYDLWLT